MITVASGPPGVVRGKATSKANFFGKSQLFQGNALSGIRGAPLEIFSIYIMLEISRGIKGISNGKILEFHLNFLI